LNQFMDDIHQIHDKFFKQIASNIENAKSFVEFSLPKEILEQLDLNTIKPINTEKISKKYKRFNLDIAFRFQTKTSSVQVYYLLEHKSETGSFSNIQILSYMLAIWEEDIKNKRPLEPIIPVVFYHGKTNWDKPIDFSDLFEEKHIYKDYLPAFKYILIDTNKIEEEKLRLSINNIYLLTALLLLKFIFIGKDLEKYSEILYIVKDLDLDEFLIYFIYVAN
ncbi:Rpn family recombination-promoting nuclease/putative transposase, partial [Thermodesulfobium sp. 4217-1]|uniref:Rpn family recombination-promoting nuclease/putative transposase n=2 Tax=Thermodesulfobium sp. 4217-1 TaxID=3120013 RepID=UPI0032221635